MFGNMSVEEVLNYEFRPESAFRNIDKSPMDPCKRAIYKKAITACAQHRVKLCRLTGDSYDAFNVQPCSLKRDTSFTCTKGKYHSRGASQDDRSNAFYTVHSIFGDERVGGGYKGGNVAQEEAAYCSSPSLPALTLEAEGRLGGRLKAQTEDGTPCPYVWEGCKRVADFTGYGLKWTKHKSEKDAQDALQLGSTEEVNWLTMVAPKNASVQSGHSPQAFRDLYRSAHVAFQLAKKRADENGKKLSINTGKWGAGVFNNDPFYSLAAQALAAKAVGAEKVKFHTSSPEEEARLSEMMRRVDEAFGKTGRGSTEDLLRIAYPIVDEISRRPKGIAQRTGGVQAGIPHQPIPGGIQSRQGITYPPVSKGAQGVKKQVMRPSAPSSYLQIDASLVGFYNHTRAKALRQALTESALPIHLRRSRRGYSGVDVRNGVLTVHVDPTNPSSERKGFRLEDMVKHTLNRKRREGTARLRNTNVSPVRHYNENPSLRKRVQDANIPITVSLSRREYSGVGKNNNGLKIYISPKSPYSKSGKHSLHEMVSYNSHSLPRACYEP